MKNSEKITLVNGVYPQNEAYDILFDLNATILNFQKIRNLSAHVIHYKSDEDAEKSILDLQKNTEKIKEIIKEAKEKNKKIVINSEISISLS